MPKKVDTGVVARIIETIRAVATELQISDSKEDRLRLAITLDERGITTPHGGKFHRGNRPEGLDRFIEKFMSEGLPVFGPDQEQATTLLGDYTTPDIPRDARDVVRARESLTDEELQTMRDIIQWWNEGGQKTMQRLSSVPVEDLKARPVFPGKKTNSGIRINDRLFRAAVAKAKTPEESPRTGGSLSSLIEILLWGYLGNDERFLKEPKDEGIDRPVDTTSVCV